MINGGARYDRIGTEHQGRHKLSGMIDTQTTTCGTQTDSSTASTQPPPDITCPVKTDCYQDALDRRERWGIRAGIDLDPGHKIRNPAYCRAGHLLVDDMYIIKDGREIRCGLCERGKDQKPASICPMCGDTFVKKDNRQIGCTKRCTDSLRKRRKRLEAREAA